MRSSTWSLKLPELAKPPRPEALTDVHPLLSKLIEGLGSNAVATLIDVKPATLTNWRRRSVSMHPRYARRITDLYYVLSRAFQAFRPNTAMRWLTSNDPFLQEHRPLDVLALQGSSLLIAALDAHESGSYP
jgi:uncharacterized protein (DUF2384 family)